MEFLRKKSGICVNRSRTALRNQIWSHIVAYAHSLKTMRTRSHLNFHMTPNSYRNGLKLTLQAGFFDLEACFFTNRMSIWVGTSQKLTIQAGWPYIRGPYKRAPLYSQFDVNNHVQPDGPTSTGNNIACSRLNVLLPASSWALCWGLGLRASLEYHTAHHHFFNTEMATRFHDLDD